MIGVDDFLLALATAAGKELGAEIAKSLVHTTTHNLATKADIAKAVSQIENFVHQELQAIEAKSIIVDVDTVVRTLSQYEKSGQVADLLEQETQLLLNRVASEIQQAIHSDQNYLWREFVAVTRFVAVSSAFWSIKVFHLQRPNEIINLADVLLEGVGLLDQALQRIHVLEDEQISPLNVSEEIERERVDGGRVIYIICHRASYRLVRGRYPGGVIIAETDWLCATMQDTTSGEVERKLRPQYDAHVARIKSESDSRQQMIYSPLANAISALRDLVKKLSGNPETTLLRFGAGHAPDANVAKSDQHE